MLSLIKKKVANLSMADIEEIAKAKMPDLNATNLQSAVKSILGTAKSMGITVQ